MAGFPGVSQSISPNVAKILQDLKERAEIGEGQRGHPLERYVKLQDLLDLNLAKLINIGPGGAVIQNPNAPDLSTPPAPTGFTVTNGFSHVFTEWDSPYDAYRNHSRTRIYRATEDNLANAVEIGQSTGFAFADMSVQTGTVYYYWCRWESTSGVLGPFNDTVGTPGQRSEDPGEILDRLVGQIRETHLYQDLNDRIDLIDAPDTGLIYLLQDEVNARIGQAQDIISDLQDLNDALVAEANERLNAILGVIGQINDSNLRILDAENDIVSLQASVGDLESGTTGNAEALSLLTARVTEAENSITSQGTSIIQLGADLEDAEGNISGNSSAINALDSRVSITEGDITSQSSLITQLQNDVGELEGDVSGHSSALSSLDSRVTITEGDISSQSSQLLTLQSDVEDLEVGQSGNSSAISSLTTRVNSAEGSISSHSSQITDLQTAIEDLELGGSGNAGAISALDARVTSAEGAIISHGSAITTLQSDVSAAEGNILGNSNAISSLGARVTATENSIDAQAEDIIQINSDIEDLEGGVSGNTSAIGSLTTRMTSAEGTISGHSSQLTSLTTSVGNAQSTANSAASAASALDTRVSANELAISSQSTQLLELISDVEDLDLSGVSATISNLDSRVTAAEGNITSQGSAISSLQSSVTDLETDTSANASAISSLNTEVSSIDGELTAVSNSTTQLNARLDSFGGSGVSVEQKFQATANEIDGLFGQYTLKIDADGHIAGFGLSIETSHSGNTTSNFIVNADRFAIVSSDTTRRVTNFSASGSVLTVTTASAHNMVVGDDVKFSGVEEEPWKGRVVKVATVPSSTVFTVAIPAGFPTTMTAKIKGNRKVINTLTRSGTLATATFAAAHGITVGGSVDISNVTQEGWNGKWVVTGVSGNNVTFTVPNTLTTPATASVKVAKLAIPFVVADNRVVMDAAFIKDATITDAKIQSLSVEKITGLNATFIQANINTIDAFEIDVVNLDVDNLTGDVNKIYPSSSVMPVELIPLVFNGIFSTEVEAQARPRYPVMFGEIELTSTSSLDNHHTEMMFFRRNNSVSGQDFMLDLSGASQVYLNSARTSITIRHVVANSSVPRPALPPGLSRATAEGSILLFEAAGGDLVVCASGGYSLSEGSDGPEPSTYSYFCSIPVKWVFIKDLTSVPALGSMRGWDVSVPKYESVGAATSYMFPRISTNPTSKSSVSVSENPLTSISEFYIALKTTIPTGVDIICTKSRMDILMVR